MSVGEIIDDAKKRKGPLEKIMKERMTEAEMEYEETKLQRLVEEEKKRIQEIKRSGQDIPPGQALSLASHVFQLAQVDPAKAKAFLSSLDQESMNKMAYLMSLENDRTGAFLKLAQSSGTNVKDLVEIAKLMRGNGGVDLKGIASIFEAGVKAARANQPQGPQNLQQGFEYIHKTFVKPFQDAMNDTNQKLLDAKLEVVKAKMPPPLPQQVEYVKQMGAALGMREGGKSSEVDLKLEEMRQSHDLDVEKMRWEQQKFMLQAEAERDKWGAIQQTFNPIFSMAAPEIRGAMKKIGQNVGRSMEGGGGAGANPQPEYARFTCPGCSTELTVPVPPNIQGEVPIKCPKCGQITPATLGAPSTPSTPTEEPSRKTRLTYKMG